MWIMCIRESKYIMVEVLWRILLSADGQREWDFVSPVDSWEGVCVGRGALLYLC